MSRGRLGRGPARVPGLFAEDGAAEEARDARRARWLDLTRRVLPGLAAGADWPIHLDHCFMRVCLDAALGAPWDARVARPAIRHLSDAQLEAAIAVAELIAREPGRLPALNAASLRGRQAARALR